MYLIRYICRINMAPLLVDKDGVSIHVRSREHLPPHVHAFSGDDVALVEIRTGEIYDGYLPSKKLKVVQRWLAEGENRSITEENFYELNPKLRLEERQIKKETIKKKVKTKKKKKGGK